jgi:hypothetical protein
MVSAGPLEKSLRQGIAIVPDGKLFEIRAKGAIATPKRGNTTCGY